MTSTRFEYRCAPYYPGVLLVGVMITAIIWGSVALSATSLASGAFRLLLLTIPTSILFYGFGWRIAYRVWCDGEALHWRAPLGRGHVAVSEVRSVRDALPRVDAVEIRTQSRVAIFIRMGPGLLEFAHALTQISPRAVVYTSRRWERVERTDDGGFRAS